MMNGESLVQASRRDFPMLSNSVHGKRLVYLDNGATTQKPQAVLNRIMHYYQYENANVHRGVHWLSERATLVYEQSRNKVKQFVGGSDEYSLVFTRGATEAINLVAHGLGQSHLKPGDEIVISLLEHHSNWVPWQQLAYQVGARLKVIPLQEDGSCDLQAYADMLSEKTALVAITHVSNTLGTVNPIKDMIISAHEVGAQVLVDGVQAVPHKAVNVSDLDADYYVFSGHKMYAPMGIGALVAKKDALAALPPYQTGGGMIRTVALETTTFAEVPERFEAGTPNVAGAVALSAACDYLEAIGMGAIYAHEQKVLRYAKQVLADIKGIVIHGQAEGNDAILSMTMDGIHPHDLASILDQNGVAARAGHHCTMPLMKWLKVPATLRVSLGLYNDIDDIDVLAQGLLAAKKIFQVT